MRIRMTFGATAVIASLVCVACGGSGGSGSTIAPTQPPVSPPGPTGSTGIVPSGPQIFVGAGDIAQCTPDLNPALATGRLLDLIGGQIFTVGDNAYYQGSDTDFRNCYEPAWGRFISRTNPTPGNHEYETFTDGAPYYRYFGAQARTPGLGYYSYPVGDWRIISLNSNFAQGVGVTANSPQGVWLQNELNTYKNVKCTLVMFHHPLFTSGPDGPSPAMRAFWQILYTAGVDVILNGHEHFYERFAPQTPDGVPDPAKGIRQFIVGTGGAALYDFVRTSPNSEVRYKGWGVLQFTLLSDSYQWDFIPVSGAHPDSGSASCH
jgi:hypothetical protein